jgi:serine/threonine protein kinase
MSDDDIPGDHSDTGPWDSRDWEDIRKGFGKSTRNDVLQTGQIIEQRYEILRRIGEESGCGQVYAAHDRRCKNRVVALKIVRKLKTNGEPLPPATVEELGIRLRNEVRILSSLRHNHIVYVFDAGEHDGTPYFVMEYVKGERLDDYCKNHRTSVHEIVRYFVETCSAVAAALEKGVCHRDLKPANIMIENRSARVIDFGLVKFLEDTTRLFSTEANVVVGTRIYMPPELKEGAFDRSDKRKWQQGDVYSIGISLRELLTGVKPEETDTEDSPLPTWPVAASKILRKSDKACRAQLDVSDDKLYEFLTDDLDWIIQKATCHSSMRYRDAKELGDDLQRFLDGKPVQARLQREFAIRYRWQKLKVRKKEELRIAAGILLIVAVIVGGAVWRINHQANEKLSKAEKNLDAEKLQTAKATTQNTLYQAERADFEQDWNAAVQFSSEALISWLVDNRYRDGIWFKSYDEFTHGDRVSVPLVSPFSINSVTYNKQGTRLITHSHLGDQLWDVATAEPLGKPNSGSNKFRLQFTPDTERVLVFDQDSAVVEWDATTGNEISGTFWKPGRSARHIAFSNDGTRHFLFAFQANNKVELWERIGKQKIATLALPEGASLDEKAVANDGLTAILTTGTLRTTGADPKSKSTKNKRTAAATRAKSQTAWLWYLPTATVTELNADQSDEDWVTSGYGGPAVFSRDGSKIVATAEKFAVRAFIPTEKETHSLARIWDVKTAKQIGEAWTHGPQSKSDPRCNVHSCAFVKDDRIVVSVGSDEYLHLIDAATGKLVSTVAPVKQRTGGWKYVAAEPDPSCARIHDGAYGPALRVNLDSGVATAAADDDLSSPSHDRYLWGGQPSTRFVTCSVEGSRRVIRELPTGRLDFGGAFSPDSGLFAQPMRGGLQLWSLTNAQDRVAIDDSQTESPDFFLAGITEWTDRITNKGCRFSPDGTTAAYWCDNFAWIVYLAPDAVLDFRDHFRRFSQRPLPQVGKSNAGLIYEFDLDERRVRDPETLKTLHRVPHDGSLDLFAFGNHPVQTDKRILAANRDNQLFLLDANNLELIKQVGVATANCPPEFSSDGTRFHTLLETADGSEEPAESSVLIWDLDGKLLHTLRHPSSVTAALFLAEGKTLLAATDHEFRLWEVSSGRQLLAINAHDAEDEDRRVFSRVSQDKLSFLIYRELSNDEQILVTHYNASTGHQLGTPMEVFIDIPESYNPAKRIFFDRKDSPANWPAGVSPNADNIVSWQTVLNPDPDQPFKDHFRLHLYNLSDGKRSSSEPMSLEVNDVSVDCISLALSPATDRIAVLVSRFKQYFLSCWNARTMSLVAGFVPLPDNVGTELRFTIDGKAILVGDGEVEFAWDTESLKPIDMDGEPLTSLDADARRGLYRNMRYLIGTSHGSRITPDGYFVHANSGVLEISTGLRMKGPSRLLGSGRLIDDIPQQEPTHGILGGTQPIESRVVFDRGVMPPVGSDAQQQFTRLLGALTFRTPKENWWSLEQSDLDSWHDAWQKFKATSGGATWLQQRRQSFQARSWHRSRALADQSLSHCDYSSASFHLNQAIDKEGSDVDSLIDLAIAQAILRRWVQARDYLLTALSKAPWKRNELLIDLAYLHLANNDEEKCKELLAEVSKESIPYDEFDFRTKVNQLREAVDGIAAKIQGMKEIISKETLPQRLKKSLSSGRSNLPKAICFDVSPRLN